MVFLFGLGLNNSGIKQKNDFGCFSCSAAFIRRFHEDFRKKKKTRNFVDDEINALI